MKLNAHANNAVVNYEMLTGQGQYTEMHIVCSALPTKGMLHQDLSKIRRGPDEPFQEFVNQLLKAAGRIFHDSDAGLLHSKAACL